MSALILSPAVLFWCLRLLLGENYMGIQFFYGDRLVGILAVLRCTGTVLGELDPQNTSSNEHLILQMSTHSIYNRNFLVIFPKPFKTCFFLSFWHQNRNLRRRFHKQ